MKGWVFMSVLLVCLLHVDCDNKNQHGAEFEDNEFAEFEDFVDGSEPTKQSTEQVVEQPSKVNKQQKTQEDDDAVVETEEEEVATLDPDEFEGLPGDDTIWENENKKINKKKAEPELKIANVPLHLRSWDKYYLEILMAAGLSVYLLNFFIGKAKNNSIASSWLQLHIDYIKTQFLLVGDDPGNKKPESTNQFVKESEHNYSLWCSGRACCEGMLVELKLLKRQDLISIISHRIKPASDQVTITVTLSFLDPFVFCVGNKKAVTNLYKNMQDIGLYCTEKSKSGDKYGLSSDLVILSELYGELPAAILDTKVVRVLNENESLFDSLHISDQYSGIQPADQDEQTAKIPEIEKIIILTLNIPTSSKDASDMTKLLALFKMLIYLIDKLKRYRLSRESKLRADKHRQEAMSKYLKQTHAQRQEAAQLKKEEKARALKDKMMNEEDPEKQRRMDEQLHRREMNKKNKKMMKGRQFKVKAM